MLVLSLHNDWPFVLFGCVIDVGFLMHPFNFTFVTHMGLDFASHDLVYVIDVSRPVVCPLVCRKPCIHSHNEAWTFTTMLLRQ